MRWLFENLSQRRTAKHQVRAARDAVRLAKLREEYLATQRRIAVAGGYLNKPVSSEFVGLEPLAVEGVGGDVLTLLGRAGERLSFWLPRDEVIRLGWALAQRPNLFDPPTTETGAAA